MITYPHLSPEIFSLGPLKVRWYGLMYVIGFLIGHKLIALRAKQGLIKISYRDCENMVTYMIVSMLIGSRLTYVFVYNWAEYRDDLLSIFAVWKGGLSFHGAAIGMVVGCFLFARSRKISFYSVTDCLAYCAAPGYFFGRMGNFINGELYGRSTDVPWAMIFPTDPQHLPRHPSQLYQGFAEGLLIFVILFITQKTLIKTHKYRNGIVGTLYLVLYGSFRFVLEFFRQPDEQLGFVLGPLSMGQLLSILTAVAGALVMIHVFKTEQVYPPQLATKKFLEATGSSG